MPLAVGSRFGAYEVVSFVGAGGMGEVWKARDSRLERTVALKVLLPAGLADARARSRLLHEARTASKLNHPGICTVHEVGEAEGQPYIAMELVEGKSLAERIADALAHAHRHGVVHRDLKSGNVVVTPDERTKVLDFGLAREVSLKGPDEATTQQQGTDTRAGLVAGTPAYMAPEQFRGQGADPRSDVWALGVVLYEMASGRRPFRGHTGYELTASILGEPPSPLPSSLDGRLRAMIERCLEKSPGRRYQDGAEALAALRAIRTGRPEGAGRRWSLPRPPRLATAVALAALLASGAGLFLVRKWLRWETPAVTSLAVLPLENLSGDAEQAYLANGVHEALITELSKLRGLRRVIARSSVLRYAKSAPPLATIAHELGVDAIVTGSVLRMGSRVQVTAHLVRASPEEHLWGERYDRDLRDVLSLENDIVMAITREIGLRLTKVEKARLAGARPVDPEAFDATLKGRFHWSNISRESMDVAERYFQLALSKDPAYAPAHVGLADVWMMRGDAGFLSPREALPKAREAVTKALALDESLADAHVTMGALGTFSWDWDGAEREFRRAIELNPSLAWAHFAYADLLITFGRSAEWEKETRRTEDLAPLDAFFQCFRGWHLVYLGRHDEAIRYLRKALEQQPVFSSAQMGLWGAWYRKGDEEAALAAAEKFFEALSDGETVQALSIGKASGGYRGAMKRAAEVLAARASTRHVPAVRIARVFAHAGERDRAVEWLERAYEAKETALIHVGIGRDWEELRSDSRYQSLLRRMGLPPR